VTFLVTDAPGQEQLCEETVKAHGGVCWESGGEVEAVVAVFPRAADALTAASALRRAIEPKARIALSSVAAGPRGETAYLAAGLSRCTRLQAIAREGQVLLSGSTGELARDDLPDGATLTDLGVHRLGDGARERAFRLDLLGLPVEEGPLHSLDALPNNLPEAPTSFVGRERELREAGNALAGARCLTLVGPGGSGKTRLGLRVSADALARFPDGAWWVALAPLDDPASVEQVVAATLGLRPRIGRSTLDAVVAHLETRRALIVMDNCEHVTEGASRTVKEIVDRCPGVSILCTSREPLATEDEETWHVPTLSHSDAVRLFAERSRGLDPGFELSAEDAIVIGRICVELDGIPLAIELAAARTRMLSLEQIEVGLKDRFRLLAGDASAPLSRHDTLWASVDWSYRLLAEPDRTLFRRLAVFRGGFTLEACEAVLGDDEIEDGPILVLLAALVDRSLVSTERHAREVRYRLLEMVRQFAQERLAEADELDAVRRRHMDVFVEIADRAAPKLVSPEQKLVLEALDAEGANFDAALEYAVENDPDSALRLCVALALWWRQRGLFPAGEQSLARALAAALPEPSPLRARAQWGWAYLLAVGGDYRRAIPAASEALEMAEELGESSTIARALHVLALFQRFADPAGARPGLERSRRLARATGDYWCLINATQVLAYTHLLYDDYEEGERLLAEIRPLIEEVGYSLANDWFGSSMSALARAEEERFFECAERAVSAAREIGEPIVEAWAQATIAHYELAVGRTESALGRLEASRERLRMSGAGSALPLTEAILAHARATLGDFTQARADLENVVESGADFGYQLCQATAQLAEILRASGDRDGAKSHAQNALELGERLGAPRLTAWSRECLGRLAAERGEWAEAESLLQDALGPLVERRLWMWVPQVLDALAQVAAGMGHDQEAARLLGAVQAGRARLGLVRWAVEEPAFVELERRLRDALGDDDFEAACASGATHSLDETAAWLRRARGSRKRPADGWESLTPTELEVARHAAAGLTNPQIGERMFITRGTVKVHLSHIYGKLGIQNRAELAAEAARRLATHSH
jgi:predicted ATPase/DNA-binding CsgD family transcriptional regulator